MKRALIYISILLLLAGASITAWYCIYLFFKQDIGETERGVKFSAMPKLLGGGVEKTIYEPGSAPIVFPWETLYKVRTDNQTLIWEETPLNNIKQDSHKNNTPHDSTQDATSVKKHNPDAPEYHYIETRAADGNTVRVAVFVQYRVIPTMVRNIVEKVGLENVSTLVRTTARADIWTYLNTLKTKGFIDSQKRNLATIRAKHALNNRLNPEGIEVLWVEYKHHRFEREKRDGTTDTTYQDKIDSAQETQEAYQREPEARKTLIEGKQQLFNDVKGEMNTLIEEANGFERSAQVRGDNYLKRRQYNAEEIRQKGIKEIEGLTEQIKALSGPGGNALLRLKIAQELSKQNSRFVVINGGDNKQSEVDVRRIDANELINQIGGFATGKEGLGDKPTPSDKDTVK